MSEFYEGDLVEATKGETVIRGRLAPSGWENPELALTLALKSDVPHLIANGYTITVIERAPDPLPAEPGSVLRGTGANKSILMRRYLSTDWVSIGDVTYDDDEARRFFHGQFEVLRPEAEVAAETVEQIAAWFDTVRSTGNSLIANRIREKFGVTS